jgi:hypothetical protein
MPRAITAALVASLLLLAAAGVGAQSFGFRQSRGMAVGRLPEVRDGFTFCRLVYNAVRREDLGQGWETDYPMADQNLMIRLSELTKTEVTWFSQGRYPQPSHALVSATDPEIFQCPFLFASDVGTAGFNEAERKGLREYLLKGGFLWVDDFWGPTALQHWLNQMGAILPESQAFPIPAGHPILSTFYFVDEFPQIPSIQYWRSSRGGTSERGSLSANATLYGLTDANDRLVVLMSHNTDIADGWERENEDYEFFHLFSPRGYAVGINVAIWSMTH